jgi:hypothetical protein
MGRPQAQVRVAAELHLFLKPAHRGGPVAVDCDGVSSLGHVVQSLGIPLTEVGALAVNGRQVPPRYRPGGGDAVQVGPVNRPQPVPAARFVCDVHLGALARRLRLAGIDTAYTNDAGDDTLIQHANAARRILLTQDRALLCRRRLWLGAYVYGTQPDGQLAPTCWTGSPHRWLPGPAARPATACCPRSPRPRWNRCCHPAPGAPTRSSPAAPGAARCTGAAPTAGGWRPSSPPPTVPCA